VSRPSRPLWLLLLLLPLLCWADTSANGTSPLDLSSGCPLTLPSNSSLGSCPPSLLLAPGDWCVFQCAGGYVSNVLTTTCSSNGTGSLVSEQECVLSPAGVYTVQQLTHPLQQLVGLGSTGNSQQGCTAATSNAGTVVATGGRIQDGNNGAAWTWIRTDDTYTQYALASPGGHGEQFGNAVSLSADGSILAVGAFCGDNVQWGIIYVYGRSPSTQQPWSTPFASLRVPWDLTANGPYGPSPKLVPQGGWLGYSVSVSGDGSTIAGGVPGPGGWPGVGYSGSVMVWNRTDNAVYTLQSGLLQSDNATASACFGAAVALDYMGNTLAVGAPQNINGNGGVSVHQQSAKGA